MDIHKLHDKIYSISDGEKWHLENPGLFSPFYNKLKKEYYNGQLCYCFDFINTLKENSVGIVRESRFTEIPLHYHKDMELSIVYSGECTFNIQGNDIKLTTGDVCIIDTDVMHNAKYKGENDIVFNIVFRKSFFSSNFLAEVADKGILGDFFLNAIIDNRSHDNYLVFRTKENPKFFSIVNLLLFEYYWPSTSHASLIEHYLSILFLELINTLHQNSASYYQTHENQKNMMKILKYIEENFSTCSLEGLSKHTHFSTSYIFKLLKSTTGSSFSALKLQQQLKRAEFLLVNTSLSIAEIIEQVGLKNPTYFYNKFKEAYNKTPSEYRKMFAQNNRYTKNP